MGGHAGRSAGHQQRQSVNVMTDKQGKHDWSDWDRWCDARIDRKRSFDRAVLIELVAELKGMIQDQGEKLRVQAEDIRNLELKFVELRAANDLRSETLAEHQIAIAELRRLANAEQAKIISLPDVPQRRGLN
jgi:hypothetical protein